MARLRLNPLAYAHVVRELQHGPSTVDEIAAVAGLSHRTARDFLAALERVGAAFVRSWEPDAAGHARVAVWQLGEGKSAVAPIGYSGLYHRARKLAAQHGVTTKVALAALRKVDGHLGKASTRLTRQAAAAA